MTLAGNWNYPTQMVFGAGVLAKLPEKCAALGMAKPLLITDEGLKDSAIVSKSLDIMAAANMPAGLFAGVKGNPTGENVMAGVQAYKDGGYDGVIAFGGGSGIDAAKAVALMVGQDRPLWDFEDVGDNWTRVNEAGVAPIVAVPTTAGTGSEVGRASVISNADTHEKKIIFHPKMLPAIVIADPEVTLGLPAHLTAATGIDAFVHCFEAYCAPGYHPMADGVALEGMRLIKEHLVTAYKDGTNIEARSHMLVASSMGATAFQKGLGSVHALAHSLGGMYDKHHGLLNAILLPYVMLKNREAIAVRMDLLARFLDLDGANGFDAVYNWVLDLRAALSVPHTLAEIGINDEDAAQIGVLSFNDPSAGGNPISLSVDEYAELFVQAVHGQLVEPRQAA
ncbi:MAG: iron-containing alcohol dehydrogenase [Pseudomonadota bacterium]|nr:alcohol dehydrogenase [Alphaproteobacteria bacterium]MEC7701261.1 iron-containing alcohol dehydrogenase [Pseudomonadota bacterium]MEE3323313.1 iron-containing alcohol dehydrogenase [Pseudomonadota bacterium]|tara:strand:- start:62672 stop:63856 length:1185 start_codon:yes stop_codon:yes gene_type:complete